MFVTGSKSYASGFVMGLLACANVAMCLSMACHSHTPAWSKLHDDQFQLDLCPCGSTPADAKGEGSARETTSLNGASSLGERCVQRACLAPTGRANAAHLPLQFYFHIISISKSCLAALAFASDKSRVRKGWKKEKSNKSELHVVKLPWIF